MSRGRSLRPGEKALWDAVAQRYRPDPRAPAPVRPAPKAAARPAASIAAPAPPAPIAPFRLGERAQASAPADRLAPPIAEELRGAPVSVDRKIWRGMKRGKLVPEAKLDLHGMTLARAQDALTEFVRRAHGDGLRLVLVITGKGRGDFGPLPTRPGALRHAVPHWLRSPPLAGMVQQVSPAHRRHGGDGALYVYLRRAR